MAGHSKFKNIQHRKGAQDAKRAKLFARLLREVTVAARSGSNPEFNPRLRSALLQARSNNVPKDNIERAVQKSGDVENLEEIIYAGYGPAGVAIIVEVVTDNHRRTASSVRTVFSKQGYEMVERNAVLYQFDRKGYIDVPLSHFSSDEEALMFAETIGAADFLNLEDGFRFLSEPDDFLAMRTSVEKECADNMTGVVTGLLWEPNMRVLLNSQEEADKLGRLLELLDEADSVDAVYSNAEW